MRRLCCCWPLYWPLLLDPTQPLQLQFDLLDQRAVGDRQLMRETNTKCSAMLSFSRGGGISTSIRLQGALGIESDLILDFEGSAESCDRTGGLEFNASGVKLAVGLVGRS